MRAGSSAQARPRDPPRPGPPRGHPQRRADRHLSVWFGAAWHGAPIYRRAALAATPPTGPAIIEQMDTTVLLDPGNRATRDRDGNLLIQIDAG